MSNTSMNLNLERLNRLNEKLNYVSIYNLTIHKNQSINNDFSSY